MKEVNEIECQVVDKIAEILLKDVYKRSKVNFHPDRILFFNLPNPEAKGKFIQSQIGKLTNAIVNKDINLKPYIDNLLLSQEEKGFDESEIKLNLNSLTVDFVKNQFHNQVDLLVKIVIDPNNTINIGNIKWDNMLSVTNGYGIIFPIILRYDFIEVMSELQCLHATLALKNLGNKKLPKNELITEAIEKINDLILNKESTEIDIETAYLIKHIVEKEYLIDEYQGSNFNQSPPAYVKLKNWELFSEMELAVCDSLATSICSDMNFELKFLEECFSEKLPDTKNKKSIIIDYINREIISFKKIMKRCPQELVIICENYLSSLISFENKSTYCRIEDSLPDVRIFLAANFSSQIKKISDRFKSVDDINDFDAHFWQALLMNEDPLIKFNKNLMGKFFKCMTSIKWNHDLTTIVKKYKKGLLNSSTDYQFIDLIEWSLIDDGGENTIGKEDESEIFNQENLLRYNKKDFDQNENIIENRNAYLPNKILSDADLKIVFDMLELLRITSENIYILGPRKRSSIRAVLETLIRHSKIAERPIKRLCIHVSDLINADLKSLPDKGNTFDDYEKKTSDYLKNVKL